MLPNIYKSIFNALNRIQTSPMLDSELVWSPRPLTFLVERIWLKCCLKTASKSSKITMDMIKQIGQKKLLRVEIQIVSL